MAEYAGKMSAGNQALSILKSGLQGQIQSVHRNSFYCLFPDRQVLLIHEDTYGIIPFGIAVNGLSNLLTAVKLQPGMEVVCQDSEFVVPEANVKFFLGKLSRLPTQTTESEELVSEAVILANLYYAIGFLKEKGSKQGLGGLVYIIDALLADSVGQEIEELNHFCRSCHKQFSALLVGITAGNYQNIRASLERLLGLGPGLTPSMDDILVGLVCTLCYLRASMGDTVKGLSALRELVLSLSPLKTSLISSTYLVSAAQGESFTIVDDVIRIILHKSRQDDRDRVFDNLLAVGSNSGSEMFLGIIVALRLVLNQRQHYGTIYDI